MHFLPAPMPTVFCFNNGLVEQMSEVVGMSIGPQDNIAAAAAITAIRSPFRNEFLAPETDTSASAVSGLRENFDTIDKHGSGHCHREPLLSSHCSVIAFPCRRFFCHSERSERPSMTPTITQSRKPVTECEIPRRLMRLSMTSASLLPGRIHSSRRQRFALNRGDEVARFSDDEASALDAFGNTILGPSNLVAIHTRTMVR